MQGYGLIAIQNDVRLNYLQFNAVCNLIIILCFDSLVGYLDYMQWNISFQQNLQYLYDYIGDSADHS